MNRLPGTVRQLIAALRGLIIFTIICGIAYPVIMFGVGQLVFHNQANGSLVSYHGKVVGSSLLCQEFVDSKGNPLPQYFQPRPSVAADATDKTDYGCNPLFSGASNLGPNNPVLVQDIKTRQQQIAKFDHVKRVPDPPGRGNHLGVGPGPLHLTAERGHPGGPGGGGQAHQPGAVRALVSQNTQGRVIGFLGEPRVNVLNLNIALDTKYPVSG